MAAGEYETIAIGPIRILGIVLHHPRPQRIAGRGQTHGCARMPGVGLLDRIHGEGADGIDAKIVDGRLLLGALFAAHVMRLLWRWFRVLAVNGRH